MSENNFVSPEAVKRLKKRRGVEFRFRLWGKAAVGFALAALIWLLVSIVGTGHSAFSQHFMTLDFELSESTLDPTGARDAEKLRGANYRRIVQQSLYAQFPEVTERKAKQEVFALVSASGATNQLRQMVYQDPSLVGQTVRVTVPTSDQVDQLFKGYIKRETAEDRRKVSNRQIEWADSLKERGIIRKKFNKILFTLSLIHI